MHQIFALTAKSHEKLDINKYILCSTYLSILNSVFNVLDQFARHIY